MSNFKELESIPWFAVTGGFALLSLLLYTTNLLNFWQLLVPTYLTQAILYIALGVGLRDRSGKTEVGFVAFLMAGVWFLDQMLHWSGLGGFESSLKIPLVWLLFLAQVFLGYLFFTDQKVRYVGKGGETWVYAGVAVVFFFAAAKIVLGLAYSLPFALPLWGVGVLILSLGYLLKPVVPEWSLPLQLVGTSLAAVSALTIAGPGLSML